MSSSTRSGPTRVRTTLVAPRAGELNLMIGSSCPITVALGGKSIYRSDATRTAVPDTDVQLVRVNEGDNVLEVELRRG